MAILSRLPSSRPAAFLLAITLAAVLMAGCSNDPPPTPTVTFTADDAVNLSRNAMEEVDGFHFDMSHPSGNTSLPGGLALTRATGSAVAPDSVYVNAEALLGSAFVRVEGVVIGEDTYMTNPLTGNWSAIAPEDSPFGFLDPVQLVTNVLDQVEDPQLSDQQGTNSNLVITASVPATALEPLVGIVNESAELTLRLLIHQESYLLQEARIEGPLQSDDEPNAVRLIKFSGFGEEISIEPPI